MADWTSTFFDETYATVGLETSDAARRDAMLDVLVGLLGVAPGATIFDQCCGIGRLALPLARRGFTVIGVEQAARYVDIASERARAEQLPCSFHAADAYTFETPTPCDAGINWFTSFGYDRDDRRNLEMLRRARASLVPGGRFALDTMSLPFVFAHLRATLLQRVSQPDGELLVIQEPTHDFAAGMITSRWTFVRPDGSRDVRTTENRAYMPVELVRMFTEVGFEDIALYGPEGRRYDHTSARLIVVGRTPRV